MDVRVLGISGSSQMILSEHGIDLAQWEEQYQRYTCPSAAASCHLKQGRLVSKQASGHFCLLWLPWSWSPYHDRRIVALALLITELSRQMMLIALAAHVTEACLQICVVA